MGRSSPSCAADITGPVQDDWGWEVWHKYWVEQRKKFLNAVGLPTEKFVEYWQKPDDNFF